MTKHTATINAAFNALEKRAEEREKADRKELEALQERQARAERNNSKADEEVVKALEEGNKAIQWVLELGATWNVSEAPEPVQRTGIHRNRVPER